jgi:hypothetical protein
MPGRWRFHWCGRTGSTRTLEPRVGESPRARTLPANRLIFLVAPWTGSWIAIPALNLLLPGRRKISSWTPQPHQVSGGNFQVRRQRSWAASDDTVIEYKGESKTKAEWRSDFQAQFKPIDAAKLKQMAEEHKAKLEAEPRRCKTNRTSAWRTRTPRSTGIRGIQCALSSWIRRGARRRAAAALRRSGVR